MKETDISRDEKKLLFRVHLSHLYAYFNHIRECTEATVIDEKNTVGV